MNNVNFYVKYLNNQPVKISTHITSSRVTREYPLQDVGDLIEAFQARPGSLLASTDSGLLTLHLPDGAGRSALVEDCFAVTDSTGTTLRSGLALTQLNGIGSDDLHPLIIIKAK